MTLSAIASLATAFLFGVITILLSIREEKTKKILTSQYEKQKQKTYQIEVLKEIQDRIGYSLDIEKVTDVIIGSLRNLLPHSTASSLIVKEAKLVFETYVEENVGKGFIEAVKKSMITSLATLLGNLPKDIEEKISGVTINNSNLPIASFFHIPLVVSDKIVGLINVSSVKPDLYKEEEVTILYQITDQASNALTKLQKVLTTEKGKLTSMIRGLADGVFMVDTQNNLLIINDSAKSIMHIEKDRPVFLDIIRAFPISFDLVFEINESISQNKTVERKEIVFTASGETAEKKSVQIFITPVIAEQDNKAIGASILLHDITIEKNIAQLKEDFTNMIVHELRAPVAAIKDASELIISDRYKFTRDEQKEFLQIISQQSKLLLYQIGSILDAAKLEAGKFTIQKSRNDIGETIKNTTKLFSSQAAKKSISLSYDLPPSLPLLSFDPIRISQVLNNLLSNSLKFTPDGGKITISANNEQTNKLTNNQLTISVSDTGIGIPKEQQANLFSKFSQVVSTPQHLAKDGSGLGLYVSKGIVEAHDGSISVESSPDEGTAISFSLPIDETVSTVPELPKQISSFSRQTLN